MNEYIEDNFDEDDHYSPTDWNRNIEETDDDYEERMEDLEGYYND